jgi:cell division protein FtsL
MASPIRLLTPGRHPAAPKPKLEVVQRRRFAWFAVTTTVMISIVMVGAVLLHTRIAERQLEIDRLERAVRQEQESFDLQRARRAELRSPARLAELAAPLNMVAGAESTFVPVQPMMLAITIARTGTLPTDVGIAADRLAPLDQFRLVKAVGAEAP